ncbi:hypothetical protein PHMEG_00024957 [Phytophthora megakarya]|uniref:Uncharacterized protein n=1 Tax=Phytophthora megakarya TaxID=4795 RepID=A0A225VCU1_9STRA|nr:hypothetical protein PHMEG_00024957 [Phytophthora megakarya]
MKLENPSRASPFEMDKVLYQSRVAFQAKKQKFSSITETSKRLKAHYNKIKRLGQLQARERLRVGDLQYLLVIVKHVYQYEHVAIVYNGGYYNNQEEKNVGFMLMTSLNSLSRVTQCACNGMKCLWMAGL